MSAPAASAAVLRYPKLLASLVKLEHTIFALPFAYVGAFLAVDGVPGAGDILWVTLAMVGARTLAMALNRLIDAGVDARNPRTAARELPRGAVRPWHVVVVAVGSLALFLVAVYELAPIVGWLWPIPVAAFVVYPYLKRFTWLCHLWLGVVDGLAPVGAWAAITNELPWQAWLLGAAVALWIGGFDVLYALFDVEVDRAQGLHSIPARFGGRTAFWVSRLSHLATVGLLVGAGLGLPVGTLYWIGVAFAGVLLAYEHSLVSPTDRRRLDMAFFTMNGLVSVGFFAFVLADVLVT
jgi:4-hydroxybenzoate polyprenyltransferase